MARCSVLEVWSGTDPRPRFTRWSVHASVPLIGGRVKSHTGFRKFSEAATQGNFIPMFERLFSDNLTPVLAYRCLVKEDDRDAPSFLFESVTNGDQSVRATHCGTRRKSSSNASCLESLCPLLLTHGVLWENSS